MFKKFCFSFFSTMRLSLRGGDDNAAALLLPLLLLLIMMIIYLFINIKSCSKVIYALSHGHR